MGESQNKDSDHHRLKGNFRIVIPVHQSTTLYQGSFSLIQSYSIFKCNLCVMVNFIQLDWATDSPDIWLNIILHVFVRVFLAN